MEEFARVQLMSEEQRELRRQVQESFHQNVNHQHQLLVLVAGVLGFVVPALHSQGPSLMNPWFLRAGAIALGVSLLIGVLNNVVGKWLQLWLTVTLERQFTLQMSAMALIAGGDEDAGAAQMAEVNERFTADFAPRQRQLTSLAAVGDVLFFGPFLTAMVFLVNGLRLA